MIFFFFLPFLEKGRNIAQWILIALCSQVPILLLMGSLMLGRPDPLPLYRGGVATPDYVRPTISCILSSIVLWETLEWITAKDELTCTCTCSTALVQPHESSCTWAFQIQRIGKLSSIHSLYSYREHNYMISTQALEKDNTKTLKSNPKTATFFKEKSHTWRTSTCMPTYVYTLCSL